MGLEREKEAEIPSKRQARRSRDVGQRLTDRQELEGALKGFLEDKRKT
jgi:hypothetical protein